MRSQQLTRLRSWRLALIGLVAFAVLTACAKPAASPTPTPVPPTPVPSPAAVPTPRAVLFPADEAAHENQLEWWYYSGHLEDERGQRYGFHFVVFQARGSENRIGYISNLGITDLGRSDHVQGYQATGNPQPQPSQGFAFRLADWELRGDGKDHSFRAVSEGYGLDLTMTPTKPAALHNEIGWLDGPTGWTYYYSWTRMDAKGTLTRPSGESLRVQGTTWMDHQWGEFTVPGAPAGWQWFALQLDDRTEIMVTEARDGTGQTVLYGTFVEPDGRARLLTPADGLGVEVLGHWKSPHTGADYPSGWRLRVGSRNLEFELQPAVQDQEITAMFPPSAIYWEGAANVTGKKDGAPLGGRAYVELVGYVQIPGLTPPARQP